MEWIIGILVFIILLLFCKIDGLCRTIDTKEKEVEEAEGEVTRLQGELHACYYYDVRHLYTADAAYKIHLPDGRNTMHTDDWSILFYYEEGNSILLPVTSPKRARAVAVLPDEFVRIIMQQEGGVGVEKIW